VNVIIMNVFCMKIIILQKICRTNIVIPNKNIIVVEITNLFICIALTAYF